MLMSGFQRVFIARATNRWQLYPGAVDREGIIRKGLSCDAQIDKWLEGALLGRILKSAICLLTAAQVVLKSAKKDDANLAREIHHHRQFLHPHIARLYEIIVTENLVWLVLEYCPGWFSPHGNKPEGADIHVSRRRAV